MPIILVMAVPHLGAILREIYFYFILPILSCIFFLQALAYISRADAHAILASFHRKLLSVIITGQQQLGKFSALYRHYLLTTMGHGVDFGKVAGMPPRPFFLRFLRSKCSASNDARGDKIHGRRCFMPLWAYFAAGTKRCQPAGFSINSYATHDENAHFRIYMARCRWPLLVMREIHTRRPAPIAIFT